MFADIFIQNNFKKIDDVYTYRIPEGIKVKPAMRVIVPFGKSVRVGMVLNLKEKAQSDFIIRDILDVLDFVPIIDNDLIELGKWMVDHYLIGYSKAFAPILPPGDLKELKKELYSEDENSNFSGRFYEDLNPDERKLALKLIDDKRLFFKYSSKTKVKKKFVKLYRLIVFESDILNSLSDVQKKVVEQLRIGELTKKEILKNLNISDSPINTLLKKGIIGCREVEVYRKEHKYDEDKRHILNESQKNAVDQFLNTDRKVSLLYGLTGSGKTEVYLNLTEKYVESGKQVIVLVPEIGLTPQMIERFSRRFKGKISVIHSKLSKGERYDEYRKVRNSEVDIVVGVRSAVFAPFKNLGLIIIDEEHDPSYDYHDGLKYDTTEVAIHRMKDRGKVLLGSATPSIESYYLAKNNSYKLLTLKTRAKGILPRVEVVDMRDELSSGNILPFSRLLISEMKKTLLRKEQIMLFLNRRGFSNFISCRSCGEVIKCKNCDISLTYHKSNDRLICHYCGFTQKMPEVCPSCGSRYIKRFGMGTQKVEEEIKKLFPKARILRMDRDSVVAKDSYEKYYRLIKNREVDIIIGTQMISKGLDFDNLTLVGVIAADLSLYISDYRAQERTFSLLTQVSGRAGRSNKRGKVVIQSYAPDHYSIALCKRADYENFYRYELSNRKMLGYPPFTKLVGIKFESANEEAVNERSKEFLKILAKNIKGLNLMATRVIKLPKIKKLYRNRILLKVPMDECDLLLDALKWVKNNSSIDKDRDVVMDFEF